MKIELTEQDLKTLKRIMKLEGNKGPLDEMSAWNLVSNVLIRYENILKESKGE